MSTKTYFSNRIYKNTLPNAFVESICGALSRFNRAKQYVLDKLVKEKRSGQRRREKSLHLLAKDNYQIDDYYANSAVQAANAQVKSLNVLKNLYVEIKNEQIRSINKKLKNDRSRLTTLRKIKTSFIKNNPTFPKRAREQLYGNYFVVKYKTKTDIYYHRYAFEHMYLDPAIQQLKTRIGFLNGKLNRKKAALEQLKTRIPSAVFGTKKLFKSQYTKECYLDNHDTWLQGWQQSRYSKMAISGRKDAKYGNFVFNYALDNQTLHFRAPNGLPVCIENLSFPHGQEEIVAAIQTQLRCKDKKKYGKPIAWSLEDHGDYYIIKCMVDVESNPPTNYSKSAGVIGIDCNVDHFAVADVNVKGQLLSSHAIPFDIQDKTSGQITKVIEAEAIGIVDLALRANKPIALEKLDTTTSKVSKPYGNKKANRKISMFAYNKMNTAITSRAEKMGVAVFEVNPAYTSQIGKMKYMKPFGISIHEAASYVIARRAMGFKEKLPPVLRALLPEKMIGAHHWAQWKYVSKHLKEIRTHTYYLSALFDVNKFHLTGECFVQGALTVFEQNSLSNLESRKAVS